MKKLSIFLIILSIAGCSEDRGQYTIEGKRENVTKGRYTFYVTVCIDDVTYFLRDRGITVALDKESKIIPCKLN
jgi:hypothetical protein